MEYNVIRSSRSAACTICLETERLYGVFRAYVWMLKYTVSPKDAIDIQGPYNQRNPETPCVLIKILYLGGGLRTS